MLRDSVLCTREFCLGSSHNKEIRFFQTEAERRRREAGVKQSMEIRVRSCMWVCMYGIWN